MRLMNLYGLLVEVNLPPQTENVGVTSGELCCLKKKKFRYPNERNTDGRGAQDGVVTRLGSAGLRNQGAIKWGLNMYARFEMCFGSDPQHQLLSVLRANPIPNPKSTIWRHFDLYNVQ